MNKRSFASDNNSGVHNKILKAMQNANNGHVIGYGDDIYTRRAHEILKRHFGKNIEIYFVLTGTAANTLGLKVVTNSYNSIITAETAHINVDECGAPENYTGCKLLPVSTQNGKLTIADIEKHMHGFGFEHHSQPKIISITEATELGTVYTKAEIAEITEYAHQNNLLVHMDGARLCNAAVSLNCTLREITSEAGIDLLSFGISKNGAMFGEAIIFFNLNVEDYFKYYRKQGMQLISKMRYISVQFSEMLESNIWKENANHANKMAKLLARELADIPEVKITQPVQTNGVFAIIPEKIIAKLKAKYFFYIWDEAKSEVRWMTSFDTKESDVMQFVKYLKKLLSK